MKSHNVLDLVAYAVVSHSMHPFRSARRKFKLSLVEADSLLKKACESYRVNSGTDPDRALIAVAEKARKKCLTTVKRMRAVTPG